MEGEQGIAKLRCRSERAWARVLLSWMMAGLGAMHLAHADPIPRELSLGEFVELVMERNRTVQVRLMEFEINQRRYKAEQGIFEPELVLGYDRVENQRENNTEQRRSTGVRLFTERNNLYNAGLEALVPTGARLRLGYTLRDLRNSIQDSGDPALGSIVTNNFGRRRGEYQTFVGLSITQPLLKNGWSSATLASVRLAALASDLAYQEYRRQLMVILSTAEASYWNLYLAQEQVRFFEESVTMAEDLVRENRARVEAGKGADLEVMQSAAGLALRKSKLAEAQQKLRETQAQLKNLISLPADSTGFEFRAKDRPDPLSVVPSFEDSAQSAMELNPDYLSQKKKMAQENIRLAYSRNQRLPQLDLKGSYGLNGLGESPSSSWSQTQSGEFPSFSVGLELRVPLSGGRKSRNELMAAKIRTVQALVEAKETENQILNAIKTGIAKIQNTRSQVNSYREVVQFNEDLLKTQRARLEVGKVESRKILEVEADLFEAKNSVVEALVQSERARLEILLVVGTLLNERHVDRSQKELKQEMAECFRKLGGSEQNLQDFLKDMKKRYSAPHDGGKE